MVIAYASNYGIRVHASPECLAALLAADAMGKILIKNGDNIVLLNGSTFYSGVLLKPLRFSYLKNCYENYFLMPQCSITWLPKIGLQRYLWHWRL